VSAIHAPVNTGGIGLVDLFCGLGGASEGAAQTCRREGRSIGSHLALNHWEPALLTHKANHPDATHLQEDIRRVNPLDHVKPEETGLLVAGVDCTHFSRALGGKPRSARTRALAWDVVRWVRLAAPRSVIVENVPEFTTWGPVDDDGKVIASKRGEYFEEFLQALRRLGYKVEWKILCAAHYGDRTTRRRFFLQARRADCGAITWPKVQYRLRSDEKADGSLPLALPVRDIIDWNLPGTSIFNRKRPLAPATMARIFEGLRRFAGVPFIVPNFGEAAGQRPRTHSIYEPLPTVTSHGAGALVEPYIVTNRRHSGGPGMSATSLDDPLRTLCTGGHMMLAEPFLLRYNDARRVEGVGEPITTLDCSNRFALVEPFIVPQFASSAARSIDDHLPTITTTSRGIALAEPFLISYYGNGKSHSIDDPVNTVTCRDTFALVEALAFAREKGVAVVADIRLRMLQDYELAAAHSFRPDYHLLGTKEQNVRMVGGSWPVATASALVAEAIS
jgi:DNA (cytosine-5)-methyltransferase 1